MDESAIQMKNTPKEVIANKRSNDVHILDIKEKGWNISSVAWCNADEGC